MSAHIRETRRLAGGDEVACEVNSTDNQLTDQIGQQIGTAAENSEDTA